MAEPVSPERVLRANERGRRLGKAAMVLTALFLVFSIVAGYTVVHQVEVNSREVEQNAIIDRQIDADPCTQVALATTRPEVKRSMSECQEFLSGLASSHVFPHNLSCYIALDAGAITTRCKDD